MKFVNRFRLSLLIWVCLWVGVIACFMNSQVQFASICLMFTSWPMISIAPLELESKSRIRDVLCVSFLLVVFVIWIRFSGFFSYALSCVVLIFAFCGLVVQVKTIFLSWRYYYENCL
jgi:hypothetical protein